MTPPRPNPVTILVVDDDAAIRQVLGRVLAREGHTVIEAGDATRAIELAGQHHPRLAILDLCLGDGNGADLAIRLHACQADLPLILITGFPLRLHEKPELSRPFACVLTKPVDVNELRMAVNAALSETAMQTPNSSQASDPVAVTPPTNGPTAFPTQSVPAVEIPNRPTRGAGFMSSAVVVVGLVVLAGFVAFVVGVPIPGLSAHEAEVMAKEPPRPSVQLVSGKQHTLSVPEDVRASLGIRKDGKDQLTRVEAPTEKLPLVLFGSTALDPTGLMRIRARFAPAEVVAIGTFEDRSTGTTTPRELRPGDEVHKDQPLATFFSVDVGSKKNDLVDALVTLKLDQELLDASQRAYDKGALPPLDLIAAKSKVQGDLNNINRAENTLRAWNVPPEDVEAVRDEARAIIKQGNRQTALTPEEREKQFEKWARVVIKAPAAGSIVERNVAIHETVVDNTVNLFQIARVDPLLLIANASEDELPKLQELIGTQKMSKCKVRTVGAEGDIDGTIDNISYLIDVNQHSAVVKGRIANPDGRLRSGQFITVTVELPPPEDVVEVPMNAIVDDGKQTVVLVRPDEKKPDEFTLRRVEVTRRFERRVGESELIEQRAFVRSRFDGGKAELPPEAEGLLPRRPLKPGEQVITAGVLELKKELEDRESEAAKKP
jgi:membrane fusion protein, heavy metal efflux system